MYRNTGFIMPIIAPTPDGDIFWPAVTQDPVTGNDVPVLPIIVFPPMNEGTTSPSPGPSRVRVRTYALASQLPQNTQVLCGYVCGVNSAGSLTRSRPIYLGVDVDVDGPDACVIEKVLTPNLQVGFDLLGFSSQGQVNE